MDRGAWLAAVHRVPKSQTRLSDFTFSFHFHALEKEMATHTSVLAWRIPGMGLHRVGHDWSDLAAAAAALPYHVMNFSALFTTGKRIINIWYLKSLESNCRNHRTNSLNLSLKFSSFRSIIGTKICIRVLMDLQRKIEPIRNWFTWLCKLISPQISSRQTQFKPKGRKRIAATTSRYPSSK